MGTTTNAEIKLGELRARVEFETVIDGGTVSLRPARVQLVLMVPSEKLTGGQGAFPTVLGEIETVGS